MKKYIVVFAVVALGVVFKVSPIEAATMGCSPTTQTVNVGNFASLTGSGGTSTYSWLAPNGNPSSGSGATFTTTYSQIGKFSVNVKNGTARASCSVTVIAAIPQYQLTVANAGAGVGSVTSDPSGINCGTSCTANFNASTSVTLTAIPATSSVFTAWSGACSGSGLSCTVTMNAAQSVTATFDMASYALTVTNNNSALGDITSNPSGINCGISCTANFTAGTSVTLTAATTTSSTFAGWSGMCSGTGSCTVSINSAESVSATFNSLVTTGVVADQFVATDGNNAWSGDFDTPQGDPATDGPVATLDQARKNVQKLIGTKPIVIMVRGGTYYGTDVSFTSADSGLSQTSSITYENYPGETPVISGGMRLTNWTNITGNPICAGNTNCWQIALPNPGTNYFEALFYNGQRRLRPRMGATATNLLGAWGRVVGPAGKPPPYTGFVYSSTDPVSGLWANLAAPYPTGDIEYWSFDKWVVSVQRIATVTTSTHTIVSTCTTNSNCPSAGAAGAYGAGHRYLIENVKDLLQYPGQWFLDRSVSPWELTYLGNPLENPNVDTVVVPSQTQVINASGLSWVNFQGLTFEHDNFTIPTTGYRSGQLDPNIAAMVHCASCQNVVFNGNTFTQTVGVGLDIEGSSTNDTVENNMVYDIGGYGIRIGSSPTNADTDATVPHNILVTQNGVTGVGRFFPSSDGIMLGDVHDVEVSYNDITDSYHDAIENCMPSNGICAGTSNSNGAFNLNIHDNNAYNLMQGVTDDGGCYYAQTTKSGGVGTAQSATGNKFTHNLCHDVTDASSQDTDGYGGHAFYLDTYTGLWDIENNLAYRVSGVGLMMTNGPQVPNQADTLKNNIFAYTRTAIAGPNICPTVSPMLEMNVTNNLFYEDRNTASSPAFTIQNKAVYFGTSAPVLTQNWSTNMYFNSKENLATDTTAFFQYTQAGCKASSKTWYPSFSAWQAAGEDTGSLVQNPGFVNPTCNLSTAAACMADPTQDNYSLTGSPSVGFIPFSLMFGRTSGPALPTIPATFITKILSPATDF